MCVIASYILCVKVTPLVRYQLSNLLSTPQENSIMFREVYKSMPYVTCLILIGCLTGAYILFTYLMGNGLMATSDDGISQYAAIALLMLPFIVTLLVKNYALWIAALIFFNHDRYRLADMEMQFPMAVQGVLMTSLALAHAYYGFDITTAMQTAVGGLIVTEILAFYREYRIFSKGNVTFSHFFLYLCTLETMSIALLIGITAFLTNALKINI